MNLFMQVPPPSFWNAEHGSIGLWVKIILSLLVGVGLIFGCMAAPPQLRRLIVSGVTFVSGLFYVVFWLYPAPVARQAGDAPRNIAESVSFWVSDAQTPVGTLTNVLAGFLIGLGIYSLFNIHLKKILKRQRDWGFSVVLLLSVLLMAFFGYWNWIDRQGPRGSQLAIHEGWGFQQYAQDLLFDGLLQQMDAVMFSLVAFYILSAAYRAFRARSVEATILLVTALIVVLGLMGVVEYKWNEGINALAHNDPNNFIQNFRLTEIGGWLTKNVQGSSIRGIDFGVGVGLMAMGLRIWLSLEKTGSDR